MKKNYNKKGVGGLIPLHQRDSIKVRTPDEIVFLGKATIRRLLTWPRTHAACLGDNIRKIQRRLDWISGLNPMEIMDLAYSYQNPESFPKIGYQNSDKRGKPVPLDADSLCRDEKATTFNKCGWCMYSCGSSVSERYCDFETWAGLERDKNRTFDTPCFLKQAPVEIFQKIREWHNAELEHLIKEKRLTERKLKFLLSLEKRAVEKPILSGSGRSCEYFDLHEKVVCFVGDCDFVTIPDTFIYGTVYNGGFHHHDCIHVNSDIILNEGDYLGGYGIDFSIWDPRVMKVTDFEYLLKNPDFAKIWVKEGIDKREEEDNIEGFLTALKEEAKKEISCKK